MRSVIAIDPGYVSGIAVRTDEGEIDSWELPTDELLRTVWDLVREYDDVVIENYTITARTARLTRQDAALRIIGAVEAAASGKRFTKQQPAKRNRVSDAQLRRVGVYNKTPDNHANDALKHLVSYCISWNLFNEETIRRLVGKA